MSNSTSRFVTTILCASLFILFHDPSPSHAGMTATASSEDNAEFRADRAVDGDPNTRWASTFSDNQWLELDLGETKNFIGLTIQWEAAYTKEYDILVSNNHTSWSKVYSTRDGRGAAETVRFKKQSARYIKIDCKKRATDWGNSIFEIALTEATGGAADDPGLFTEGFEDAGSWTQVQSQDVDFRLTSEEGAKGSALCMNFDFPTPTGYVVAGKDVGIFLPDDYAFTFMVKGEAPENTLEFKLMDAAGNTFWRKIENFSPSSDWTKITIRKKQIVFAWGPGAAGGIRDVKRIEIGISCGTGGKGRVLVDELALMDLSAEKTRYDIRAEASTSESEQFDASKAVDGDRGTRWSSIFEDNQWLDIDLGAPQTFVGLTIYWEAACAKEYDVRISDDKENWTTVYSTTEGEGGIADLYFKKRNARYIRIDAKKRATSWGNSIWEIEIKGPENEMRMAASSASADAASAMDADLGSAWNSTPADDQWFAVDLGKDRDIGALIIQWTENHAVAYDVLFSPDNKTWQKRFSTIRGNGGRDRLVFKDLEARYVKIKCKKSLKGTGYGIREIEVKGSEFAGDQNTFYEIAAEESPQGYYPKYCSKKQTYWTVVGVTEDLKESLMNEEGMFEVGKEEFSVEPFIHMDGKLLTWADGANTQSLEKGYLPIPTVRREYPDVALDIRLFAHGQPGASSLYASYKITNRAAAAKRGKLFLTVRPFQVNPPWQCLNMKGGVARVSEVRYDGEVVTVNGNKKIFPLIQPAAFGACRYEAGDITDFIQDGQVPADKSVQDDASLASGVLAYDFDVAPGQSQEFYLAIPFHESDPVVEPNNSSKAASVVDSRLQEMILWWDNRLSRVDFHVPKKAEHFIHTLKSNLAYIFINRDGYRIQPGSRSYLRSWIRDGAMTSASILRMGNTKEVKEYLSWYSPFLFSDGRVPCVVDDRGADGCPENDSNGEFVYAFLQYYYFTQDKDFLREHFPRISKAADFINVMRNQRKTDEFKNGPDDKKVLYGLVPESISHEGYSAKPMHSYWDDFFSLKGLKDAATICDILDRKDLAVKYRADADEFRNDIYNSMRLSMKMHNINYLPGCAELGDFDATSTAIGGFPCGEIDRMPQDELRNTFERYYEDFRKRLIPDNVWGDAYTPYEIRSCFTFILMGQKEKAFQMFDFFFNDRRPLNWNHWAEVVWRIRDNPKFIGDMPHTWIGSAFINVVRSLFVYERESDRTLVLGAGIPEDWLEDKTPVGIENAVTYWGKLNVMITPAGKTLKVSVTGDAQPDKFVFKSPKAAPMKSVKINNAPAADSTGDEITFKTLPAQIEITY